MKPARPAQNRKAEDLFGFQCKACRLPDVARQFWIEQSAYPDNLRRGWRFDYAFPEFNVIVEIDGGIWLPGGGAHSKPSDIVRNMRKRNDAALAGFFVLAFQTSDVRSKSSARMR